MRTYYYSKHFGCIHSFDPYNSFLEVRTIILLLSPCIMEAEPKRRYNKLSHKVTKLVSGCVVRLSCLLPTEFNHHAILSH